MQGEVRWLPHDLYLSCQALAQCIPVWIYIIVNGFVGNEGADFSSLRSFITNDVPHGMAGHPGLCLQHFRDNVLQLLGLL